MNKELSDHVCIRSCPTKEFLHYSYFVINPSVTVMRQRQNKMNRKRNTTEAIHELLFSTHQTSNMYTVKSAVYHLLNYQLHMLI